MVNINHSIGLKIDKEKIITALTTVEGLSKWWTEDVSGSCDLGQTIQFRFNGQGPDMKVLNTTKQHVSWKCTVGPEEWMGTEIHFNLLDTEEETMLSFKHSGWKEETGFHQHCSMKWAVFLLSLKKYLEEGKGYSFPNDIKITHSNN